ncbi:MAG: TolC family protein [Candidatus Omnitrophica bacterium]|nr:TolC family protein [Candidatus Omnitrophota bacterium]
MEQPFAFVTYTLTNPDRLIVDLIDPQVESSLPESSSLGDQLVREWHLVRTAPEPGNLPTIDYLSFNLTQPAEHLVESKTDRLVIRVRPKTPPSPRNFSFDLFANPQDAAPPSLSGNSNPWSLDSVLEFGLNRHKPIQIAREEIELAQMKLQEARRALYPAASLKASWTTGTASKVNFREVSQGIQLDQPLYYSGRLREAYGQAIVNIQIAEKRQGKVKSDFSLEITQAYFQLIGARVSLMVQEGILGEVQKLKEQTNARYEKGLLTRLELLNVESQINQVQFQQATAENDLKLARLKFLQHLNLEPEAREEVPAEFPSGAPSAGIDLEEALTLAVKYRSDIQISRLLVEFNELEERIAKAKGALKVDLSTFLGRSGSAFETEPLVPGSDYFIGIKATQTWGPHGASASVTKTKTAPRLGQTTRTDSTVHSVELGLFSQLQGLSEIQQALVGLEKARNDLAEVKATVTQEVQEAYLSYNKAHLQLEYAKQKIAFREEQAKVLKAQASLNEVLPSQVLEALLRLTDEHVSEAQALTNYYVALARLNKAIGLTGYYK